MSTILRLQLIFDNTFDSLCLYISVRQRYQRDYIIANEKSPQSVAGRQIEKTVCTTTSHLCRTPDLNKMEKSLKKTWYFTDVKKNQLVEIGKDLVVKGSNIKEVVEVLVGSLQDREPSDFSIWMLHLHNPGSSPDLESFDKISVRLLPGRENTCQATPCHSSY